MGLSNEERYGKIVWTVKRLKTLLNNLSAGYPVEDLKAYRDKLWPALLNTESNSGYWVFGGGFDQTSFSGGFLYEIFDNHARKLKYPSPIDDTETDERKIQNLISRNIEVSGVLGDDEGIVVEIYQNVENFYYAVNRYQDEFSENFKELKTLISNMKGELFEIMSCNPVYFRGYLLSKILQKVICPYTDDAVKKVIVDNWLYHDLKLTKELKTEVLWDMWKDLQFKKASEITLEQRFLCLITCMDRRLGSKSYMRKTIFDTLKEFVDPEKLNKALDKCEESHKLSKQIIEERFNRSSNHCHLTNTF